MPHSSGGGSSFGGSHGGGGYHSGGSGGGSSQRISNRPFPGSHRYVYYRRGVPVYYYSTSVAPNPVFILFFGVFFTFITTFIALIIFMTSVTTPKKVNGYYDYDIRIEDNQSILGDTTQLNNTLTKFRDTTGITPYVLTVDRSTWDISEYSYNMEKYAYNKYVKTLHDECHWLVVITYNNSNDWFFEGMQGDNTDNVLSEKKANKFNKELVKNIKESNDVSQSLNNAFDSSLSYLMDKEVDKSAIGSGCAISLFSIGCISVCIYAFIKSKGRNKAVEIKSDEKETVCAYCGGRYILSTVISCPHCGASISKAERKEAEENSAI